MIELSLFSGIGGGLLGSLLLGWHTVAAVDFEPYCCDILAQRKEDGIFQDPFEIYCMDIKEFNERVAPIYTGQVDIITGGFPCQPFSVAGAKRGSADERNGFPALADTIRIVRPRYLFLENVPGLLGFEYFGFILATLSKSGYDVRWKVISAGEVGAPHRRDRLWIMAESTSKRGNGREYEQGNVRGITDNQQAHDNATGSSQMGDTESSFVNDSEFRETDLRNASKAISDSTGTRLERKIPEGQSRKQDGLPAKRCTWWDRDPADEGHDSISYVGRMAHGIPYRVERLKGLGNAQVPYQMAAAFWTLVNMYEQE